MHEGADDLYVDVDRALTLKTLESMATPCSVIAIGGYLACRPRPELRLKPTSKVTVCDLKRDHSSLLKTNMKSCGNRAALRLTACTSAFAVTP
jgi:hypothetical protein